MARSPDETPRRILTRKTGSDEVARRTTMHLGSRLTTRLGRCAHPVENVPVPRRPREDPIAAELADMPDTVGRMDASRRNHGRAERQHRPRARKQGRDAHQQDHERDALTKRRQSTELWEISLSRKAAKNPAPASRQRLEGIGC